MSSQSQTTQTTQSAEEAQKKSAIRRMLKAFGAKR